MSELPKVNPGLRLGSHMDAPVARRPRVGDWANHPSGRPRAARVAEVSPDGESVRIESIPGAPSDWLPASDYTFTPGGVPR